MLAHGVVPDLLHRGGQEQGVAKAEMLAGFGGSDAGVGGEAVEMIEARDAGPGRKLRVALLAEAFLLKHSGSTIIYDLRASHAVRDVVETYGGTSLMNPISAVSGTTWRTPSKRADCASMVNGSSVTVGYSFSD